MASFNLSSSENSLAYQGTIGLEIYGNYSEHLNFSAASIPIVYQDLEGFNSDPGPGPYAVSCAKIFG
jgi:hypothetical protein